MQFEEYALRLNASDFASRSKAKAKPQRRDSASSSTRTIPIGERTWTDVEPGEHSISDYEVSKKLIRLFRHGSPPRGGDGAVELRRMKDNHQKHYLYCHHWSDEKWKNSMARGGDKKRYQYCTDSSGAILYLRALQGQSGRSIIDPTVQDSVIIPDGFFNYIYHVRCAINLHSIINSGLIPGGQNLSNRQTVFFLLVDPMDKNHKDPDTIDLEAPRLAQYMHKAWKKHQNTVYWFVINLALKKGLKFYQTRSNAIILHETLPAYCISKVVRMETGEVICEKVYASPRGKRVVGTDPRIVSSGRKTSRSQEMETTSFHEETVKHDRTEQPVVETRANQTRSSDDSKSPNVEMAHDRTAQPVVSCHTNNVPDGSQTRSCHESTSFNVGRLF